MTITALHQLPLALTMLRAALGPVMVVLALVAPSHTAFAVCLVLALLSDYFDGVIARRLGIATEGLRRLDSVADSVFYLSALFSAWYLHSDLLRQHLMPLGALIALELIRYAFDYRKFGREASYHMWSSKLWGLTLFIGFFALLVYGGGGWTVTLAIYTGFFADFEGLAISFVLPKWQADIPTLFHAIRLRASEA
ncbi:CDP-alcohol phosphatidyltransferase family protein [uncultured Thiodictyon sp.]|uniref:CDP-alcohol phosphatidyltransferase family protein n=1 Tax=uncultured Thiodictyon sp. TaxID=1846217 RepID=UPI0025D36555|nr:CDP-alcohol phosphatidyltransferase family protein [uncultured Thiodictyon sp.]